MILIIGCSLTKSGVTEGPARSVYAGPLSVLGLEYATLKGWTPYFLSGRYGLVTPDTIVRDYDLKMRKPYPGPWPEEPGHWLGSQLYFALAPPHITRLLPQNWSYGMQKGYLNEILHPEKYR